VVMTYFKALSRYWCEYTDENSRNVTLGGVSVAFVTLTEYLAIKSLGVYRCIFHVVNNNNNNNNNNNCHYYSESHTHSLIHNLKSNFTGRA